MKSGECDVFLILSDFLTSARLHRWCGAQIAEIVAPRTRRSAAKCRKLLRDCRWLGAMMTRTQLGVRLGLLSKAKAR